MIKKLLGLGVLLALALTITSLALTDHKSIQPRTSGPQEQQGASGLRQTTETATTSVRETTTAPESNVSGYYASPAPSFTFIGKLYQQIDPAEPHPPLKDLIDTGEKVSDPNWPENFGKKLYIRNGKSLSEEAWIISKGVQRHFDPDRNRWVEAGDDEAIGFIPAQSGTR